MENPLEFLRNIRSVAVATVAQGKPAVRKSEIMLVENEKLYFITARGKPYYKQLMENPEIAIMGMGKNHVTIRVKGKIEFVDKSYLEKIFEANPVLDGVYPGKTKESLEVFRLSAGAGEVFDLSVVPPKRQRFAFGGAKVEDPGYKVTEKCKACGTCEEVCPKGAISKGDIYKIDGSVCQECGRCYENCPNEAIEPASGL
ncbi:(4Fe-4S)-binding protein [Methanosarcina sp. KYL-1]|uniref:4Fe-4S binding protein n=1 Tax=Methanosarcina sp. KYL-1 TaxID=2602068 RepID=UPI0021018913|nr:4Fe-4S binding protein [Methanosarcina sp. KYL-1]MCQ1536072.1 (4Fe-4S)-binding protein [Methanosarcina sp. KYL-1]